MAKHLHYTTKWRCLRCAVVLSAALAAGACGTLATRQEPPYGQPFGAYPMAAIGYDFVMMARAFGPGTELWGGQIGGPVLMVVGLASLPIDAVMDVILLPVDIVMWVSGKEKKWPE